MLETTETKQADSQLHFALKIIEFHLLHVVFENELIEDAILVPKKSKTLETHVLVMYERMYACM